MVGLLLGYPKLIVDWQKMIRTKGEALKWLMDIPRYSIPKIQGSDHMWLRFRLLFLTLKWSVLQNPSDLVSVPVFQLDQHKRRGDKIRSITWSREVLQLSIFVDFPSFAPVKRKHVGCIIQTVPSKLVQTNIIPDRPPRLHDWWKSIHVNRTPRLYRQGKQDRVADFLSHDLSQEPWRSKARTCCAESALEVSPIITIRPHEDAKFPHFVGDIPAMSNHFPQMILDVSWFL